MSLKTGSRESTHERSEWTYKRWNENAYEKLYEVYERINAFNTHFLLSHCEEKCLQYDFATYFWIITWLKQHDCFQ